MHGEFDITLCKRNREFGTTRVDSDTSVAASQIFRMPWAVIIISDYISIDASLFIKFRVSQVKVADL